MTCPICKSALFMDGRCPKCMEYADQSKQMAAEGFRIDFKDLSERERSAFTRIYGDVVCAK